jgi:hypothetical protein
MRFDILTALNITSKFKVFWKVTPYSLEDTNVSEESTSFFLRVEQIIEDCPRDGAAGSSEILVDIWLTLSWFSSVSYI